MCSQRDARAEVQQSSEQAGMCQGVQRISGGRVAAEASVTTECESQVLSVARHDDQAVSNALARLHRSLSAQSRLIDDLLAASRIIGGKMRLASEPVMLAPIIEDAVETAKAAALDPQPVVSVEVDTSAGPVLGDRA